MSGIKADGKATIIATGAMIAGNGGDGVSVDGDSFIDLDGASVVGNSGDGVNARDSIVTARDANILGNGAQEYSLPAVVGHPWYQRPFGIIAIGVFITVVGGVILAYLTGLF